MRVNLKAIQSTLSLLALLLEGLQKDCFITFYPESVRKKSDPFIRHTKIVSVKNVIPVVIRDAGGK